MQAPSEFPAEAFGYQMADVTTVSEIRHANLLLLIARYGSIQRLADAIERSHSQISQLKNQSKRADGRPRVIGDDLARHIEQKLELASGWMDHPQAGATSAGTFVWAKVSPAGAISDQKTIDEKVADLQAQELVNVAARGPASDFAPTSRRHDELRRLVDIISTDPELAAEASGFLAALAMRVRLGGDRTKTGTLGR